MKQLVEVADALDAGHWRVAVGLGDYTSSVVVVMLTRLGESLCQYGGGNWRTRRCDCKFLGVGGLRRGEASGCAEVRTAIDLIERLAETRSANDNQALRAKVRKLRQLTLKHLQLIEKEARLDV